MTTSVDAAAADEAGRRDALAELGGIDAHYAREWLERQAVAGLLDVEDAQDAEACRYRLPDAHAEVLHRVPGVYRSGEGLPYPEYGADCRLAIANFNRPMFVNDLADWFATVPELQARLAAEAGVADRVRFQVVDAAELGAASKGGYAAAFVFEALHDMARPVEALEAIRALLGGDGVVIVADEKVAETFTAPGDEVERLDFGFSWWHCLPASRAETPSVAAGTALRPATVREWADQAGFASYRELPVDHTFWRFCQLAG